MKTYLILRLRNAAIAYDQKGDHNLAALLTEAIEELEGPTQHTYGNCEVLAADAITRARAR
jgi:hypothetical protein